MLLTQVSSSYQKRREALMKKHPGSVFILPAAPVAMRNSDVDHPYRQDSNFYYLSGLDEPHSFLIISHSASTPHKNSKMTLFVQPKDPEKELWEGERYGVIGALQVFGADEAHLETDLEKVLPEILKGADRIFYRLGLSEAMDRRLLHILESFRRSQGRTGRGLLPIEDPQTSLGEMRLIKEPEEIDLLRKACQITASAHRSAMEMARPGMNEGEVEAWVDSYFRKNGCQRLGYGSIVASGKNAACLHYRSNNDTLRANDLLLIDAGGEYGYYTSDITRTFPIGPRFSKAQAQAYQLVLKVQKSGIALAQPGAKLPEIHKTTCEEMIEGLLSLDLLKGNPSELLKNLSYKRFYPHNTSHWLGMDVHDAGLYTQAGEPRTLEPGMVFTIEPGFYVQPSDRDCPKEYQNIGIRIEDDILITSTGCEVLTRDAPKELAEIESLRSSAKA
jgi:Xaa-Pro aminopeptidase